MIAWYDEQRLLALREHFGGDGVFSDSCRVGNVATDERAMAPVGQLSCGNETAERWGKHCQMPEIGAGRFDTYTPDRLAEALQAAETECAEIRSELERRGSAAGAVFPVGAIRSQPIYVVKQTNMAGLVSGLVGCMFAILAAITFGAVFLPFALLFIVISALRVLFSPNAAGACALLAGSILAVIGFMVSPSAWLLLGALLAWARTH